MGFSVDRIDHVEVFVRDLARSVRWYEKVLGLREVCRWDPEPIMVGAGDTKLALFQAEAHAAGPAPSQAPSPIRWRVVAWRTSAAGFQEALTHLTRLGVLFRGPVDHGTARSIYFYDPDGHALEITHYVS
jgi:catechol 2,3-dioxygenase-like lactoylglutathione lyase family enzyme